MDTDIDNLIIEEGDFRTAVFQIIKNQLFDLAEKIFPINKSRSDMAKLIIELMKEQPNLSTESIHYCFEQFGPEIYTLLKTLPIEGYLMGKLCSYFHKSPEEIQQQFS